MTQRMTTTNEFVMEAAATLLGSYDLTVQDFERAEKIVLTIAGLLDESCDHSKDQFRVMAELYIRVLRYDREGDTAWPTIARNALMEMGRAADALMIDTGVPTR